MSAEFTYPLKRWRCLSCHEYVAVGAFLRVANQKGELAHESHGWGGTGECGPVVAEPAQLEEPTEGAEK